MKHLCTFRYWGLAMLAIVLSPVAVILGVPLAIGIGLDLVDMAGETRVALLMCVAPALVLLYAFSAGGALRRAAGQVWARLRLDHAADLIQAP